jgi:hypothetical protein
VRVKPSAQNLVIGEPIIRSRMIATEIVRPKRLRGVPVLLATSAIDDTSLCAAIVDRDDNVVIVAMTNRVDFDEQHG